MGQSIDNKKLISYSALTLFVFSIICFATSSFLNGEIQKGTTQVINRKGGEIALDIPEDHTVLNIKVKQTLLPNSWSSVYVSVENNEDIELYGFGDDLWAEEGISEGYYWSESDLDFENTLVFADKGKYFLAFENEYSHPDTNVGDIQVKITELYGSKLPHRITAIFALILAIVLNEIANRTLINLMF